MSLAGDPKFTEEQKYEIAVEFVSGMLSHSEICRKWDISPTYAYKLKDRALDLLRQGMGRPTGKFDTQALAIHAVKNTRRLKAVCELRQSTSLSIGRLAIVFSEPRSSVGRWVRDPGPAIRRLRRRPISDDPVLREQIRQLCLEPRMRGYRMIRALLRRHHGVCVSARP